MSSRRCLIAFSALMVCILHSAFCNSASGSERAPAPKPLYRDNIFDGAADPVVIYNRAENNWLMFYTNRRANVPGLDGVSWVHGSPIGIAQSDDGGTTWKYRCGARFNGIPAPEGVDAKTLTYWAPDVIEHDGVYHMYLTLVPGVFTDWRHPRNIVHLTSKNLIDWNYQSTLALSGDRVIDACVYPLPGGGWRMWYNNERDGKSIYYADSPDLYKWTDKGKCTGVGERPGEGPYVFRWRGHYWMFVDLWKGLGVYRSDDLQNWTAQSGDPLLGKPGTGTDDGVNGGHCCIVVDATGDRAYCFYFTHPGRNGTISPDDKNNLELRRSSIQVVELREENGVITCDRNEPAFINLRPPVSAKPAANFSLVTETAAASIHYSDTDARVVAIAARDLAADIERVTGKRPVILSSAKSQVSDSPKVIIGTLGKSPLIDALAASGKLDVSKIEGQWETFLIATLDADSLVIAGSDPRGTAYGVYELSQIIGVSPWYWWADVTPTKKSTLHIAAGTRKYGPPSVKYRGIFINDEDWGLQPWAAKTFEPDNKGIGPKTYEKVFELLLRLKANTLWPAMHKCSPAFNSNPANAALANDYAIVMGSSHAEPMLRNNVSEWTAPGKDYNYVTNRDGVLAYWEKRMKTNGRYENIYTIGMRGIHDSGMQGGGGKQEQIARLEKIFDDQRALIAKYVSPATGQSVARVPQMFCAYKEVLDLYRGGLRVPDDVTIMFPDDNFGYIRNFPSEADRAAMRDGKRAGGFGIYYHLSYLGRPLAYLWLSTTPPALIWEEMHKAYELGADRIWIANVGDIKPAEITTEFFLQMAWDINRWTPETLPNFLPEWAAREFGPDNAGAIAAVMNQYYLFNFERRPEHLQWWLPNEKPRPSTFADDDKNRRRAQALKMNEQLAAIRDSIPAEKQDAFYELVDYPVQGSILANNRYFTGEEAALKYLGGDRAALDKLGYMGDVLNGQLVRITHRYNNLTAGGKWRNLMQLEPADADWKSMRISAWRVPNFQIPLPPETKEPLAIARFESVKNDSSLLSWKTIPGLGHGGNALALFPSTIPAISPARATDDGPWIDFKYTLREAAPTTATAHVRILPAHAIDGSGKLWLVCSFDEGKSLQLATLDINDGGPEWAQGVLENERVFKIQLPSSALTAGEHTLRLYGIDPGVVIDRVTIE